MSFNFSNNNIGQFKAQSAYKDASGMGGGGMYFRQKKRGDQPDDDIFEPGKDESESIFDEELKEEDIPSDTLFNKFVNWFRQNKSN